MEVKTNTAINGFRFTKEQLLLISIILAFILLLISIWLWYDVKISQLDALKQQQGIIRAAK